MTIVSSKEFAINQKKYYNLALNERICIKRGKNRFNLSLNLDNDEDVDLLVLAKERKNSGGEFTSTADFIKFLRK